MPRQSNKQIWFQQFCECWEWQRRVSALGRLFQVHGPAMANDLLSVWSIIKKQQEQIRIYEYIVTTTKYAAAQWLWNQRSNLMWQSNTWKAVFIQRANLWCVVIVSLTECCFQYVSNMSDAGFDKYCETYASYPNVLLCIRYICDVGRVIVNGTDVAIQQPNTPTVCHHCWRIFTTHAA